METDAIKEAVNKAARESAMYLSGFCEAGLVIGVTPSSRGSDLVSINTWGDSHERLLVAIMMFMNYDKHKVISLMDAIASMKHDHNPDSKAH